MNLPKTFNTLTDAQWEEDLSFALANGDLFLVFQPKVCDGEVVSFEGLCRWNHKRYGMIPPDIFISHAEQNSIIHELGQYVALEACKFISALMSSGVKSNVSINVSPVQLMNGNGSGFATFLAKTCRQFNVNPSQLIVEVTESAEIERDDVLSSLRLVKSEGHLIALDDFGTGYSSYGIFNCLEVNQLKIDRSFVNASSTLVGEVVIDSMIGLGKRLGMDIVVEGVETLEQHEFLSRYDGLILQGYYYSPPLEFEDAVNKAAS